MLRLLFILSIVTFTNITNAKPASILILGDSISAAYGLEIETAWVALLASRLEQEQTPTYQVINASISGDTSEGGLHRLPNALTRFQPNIVIIELGANDGLRGLSLKAMRQNLSKMVELCQQAGAKVLLLGMRLPSNYGEIYTQRFFNSYQKVADKTNTPLMPFFLEPIASSIEHFQDDGIHPNQDAQALLLQAMWPHLQPLL